MRAIRRWVAVAVAGAALSAGAGTAAARTAVPGPVQHARPAASVGWHIVKTFGCGYGGVNSITAGGRRSAWATGSYTSCKSHRHDLLIARWDGRSWRPVRPPASLADDGKSVGYAVAALSASYSWTFVTRTDSTPVSTSFALLYQSGRWRTFRLPAGTNPINSAVVFSRSNAWAFGENSSTRGGPYAFRFNGRAWRRAWIPLLSVTTASPGPRNIWEVGPSTQGWPYQLAHWTGRWHTVTFPTFPNESELSGITNLSVVSDGADGAWIAATFDESGYDSGGALLHWDGSSWAIFTAPVSVSEIGPIAHDGHGGLWGTSDCQFACSHNEMVRYSTASGWSAPVSVGPFYIDSMRLIPRTRSLWVGGWTYKFVNQNLGSWSPKHVAILKFGG